MILNKLPTVEHWKGDFRLLLGDLILAATKKLFLKRRQDVRDLEVAAAVAVAVAAIVTAATVVACDLKNTKVDYYCSSITIFTIK